MPTCYMTPASTLQRATKRRDVRAFLVCLSSLFWCRLLNVPEAASHRQGCGSTHQQPAISKLFCGVRLVLPAPWSGSEEWVREVGGFLQSGAGAQSSCDRERSSCSERASCASAAAHPFFLVHHPLFRSSCSGLFVQLVFPDMFPGGSGCR